MNGVNGSSSEQAMQTGANIIKVANAQIYVMIALFSLATAAVIYSMVLPAVVNLEWPKIIISVVVILMIFYIIKIRFGTVPLRIVFTCDELEIKTLFGTKKYQKSDIVDLEYSTMGRMNPRHFLVLSNGDIYDIVSHKSAEEIEEYIKERK